MELFDETKTYTEGDKVSYLGRVFERNTQAQKLPYKFSDSSFPSGNQGSDYLDSINLNYLNTILGINNMEVKGWNQI